MRGRIVGWVSMVLVIGLVRGAMGQVEPMGFEGDTNTFYGIGAGANITDGTLDTFIGGGAGYSNTTGSSNSFLGYKAGYSNTTGYYNNFLGYQAGLSNTIGHDNNFIGYQAGLSNTTGSSNSFMGSWAGYSNTFGTWNTFTGNSAGYANTIGYDNTFFGNAAGALNTTGNGNTFIGRSAGISNITGSGNVFLGNNAGSFETGSNKLYIGNSDPSNPLIYGEFDTRLLRINGSGHFSGLGVSKSQLHFSLSNTDTGGWITSVADNNFWLSSGAMWDQTAGGWVQKSSDGMAVMAGSGPSGYRVVTRSGCTVETVCTPVTRLTVDYSGRVGIGINPSHPFHLAGGAYSDGVNWVNGSSREYKDNIRDLTAEEALITFQGLTPVAFTYKAGTGEQHLGFVAEDVPDLVATKDRKGLSPMDIVAVLTKVVQEQQKTMEEQQKTNQKQRTVIETLTEKLSQLEAQMRDLQARTNPPPIAAQE